MTIFLGVMASVLVAVGVFAVSIVKSVLYWRHRQRDLAVDAVEMFSGALDDWDTSGRRQLCTRMLSYLRADVEYCLARSVSPRTVALGGLFLVRYASCWVRIALRMPPRTLASLCATVRRLSAAAL